MRRIVRKIEPAHAITFDDQLWPINVALLVLAGFVAGCIIALSSFDDPRLLYNGWARLASLAVTVGLLMWAATRLNSRRIRRGLQLATVLSLLVHMLLMVFLYNQRLAFLAQLEEDSETPVASQEIVTLPDYYIKAPDETQVEEHEKPVETKTPDETPDTPVERDAPERDTPVEKMPTPIAGKTPEVQPTPVELRKPEEAT